MSAEESLDLRELKQHQLCFDEKCLGVFFRSKEAGKKMQWVQDPSQSNVDNLNDVRP
jgi:hypothetical protein